MTKGSREGGDLFFDAKQGLRIDKSTEMIANKHTELVHKFLNFLE